MTDFFVFNQTYKELRQIWVECSHETHKFLPTFSNTLFLPNKVIFLRVQFNYYTFFAVDKFLQIIWLLDDTSIRLSQCILCAESSLSGNSISKLLFDWMSWSGWVDPKKDLWLSHHDFIYVYMYVVDYKAELILFGCKQTIFKSHGFESHQFKMIYIFYGL